MLKRRRHQTVNDIEECGKSKPMQFQSMNMFFVDLKHKRVVIKSEIGRFRSTKIASELINRYDHALRILMPRDGFSSHHFYPHFKHDDDKQLALLDAAETCTSFYFVPLKPHCSFQRNKPSKHQVTCFGSHRHSAIRNQELIKAHFKVKYLCELFFTRASCRVHESWETFSSEIWNFARQLYVSKIQHLKCLPQQHLAHSKRNSSDWNYALIFWMHHRLLKRFADGFLS